MNDAAEAYLKQLKEDARVGQILDLLLSGKDFSGTFESAEEAERVISKVESKLPNVIEYGVSHLWDKDILHVEVFWLNSFSVSG